MNPQPNPKDQAQLDPEELRTVRKILLDLIDTRAEAKAREVAASMAGLVLRRLREAKGGFITAREVAAIFGELLRDYGATENEPGEG